MQPALYYSPDSLVKRRHPNDKGIELHLVVSSCGKVYGYACEKPTTGWEMFRLCTDLERANILFQGERFARTAGRSLPGYQRIADVSVARV